MKKLILTLALLLVALPAAAQIGYGTAKRIQYGATLPPNCDPATGDVYFVNSGIATGMYQCPVLNTWARLLSVSPVGQDSIFINSVAVLDANFNNASPAPAAGGANCLWQLDAVPSPNNLTCYIPAAGVGTTGVINTLTQSFAGDKTFTGTVTSPAHISSTVNPAVTGQVRLAKTDCIKIRNNANTADVSICLDSSDNLILPQLSTLAVLNTFVSSASYTSGSNTCGIQEAYNAIQSTGGTIWIPAGTCDFTSGSTFTICANNISVQGQGSSVTILRSSGADAVKLCNTQSGGLHEIRVRDIGIAKQPGSLSGNGINILETASAFENSHMTFERIVISNMPEQGFHDGNCSWCSFRDLVMQGNSGRGMEIGTSAGGKGGSSNDSAFTNVEVSTNSFGGMLLWGRNDVFHGGHWFANTNARDLEVRGSNNTFVGGWFEDVVSFPSVLIRRSDPVIYGNKFYGSHFTNTAGSGTGPVISVGQAGDAANSTVGTEFHDLVFTCNDAPSPLDCVGNNYADISIDTSATNTHLVGNSYHTAIGTALIDNGSNTASLCDDIANTCFSKLFGLTLSGGGGGLFSPLVTSRSTNPASSGYLRLARTDQVCWRNNGNTADVCMTVNASDQLVAGGTTGLLGGPFISNSSAAVPINGILRMAKTDTIKFRNNANSADITALSLDLSDIVQVGGTGGFKAGASGSAIADTRELLQSVHDCGSTTTCANTANGSNRTIMGTVTLTAGSAVIASITAFTSTSSYRCQGTDKTAAAAVKIANTSTTSITITGTGTDVIDYACTGN